MKKLLVTVIGAAAAIGAFADYTNAVRLEGSGTTISELNTAAVTWTGAAGTYFAAPLDTGNTNEYSIGTLTGTLPTGRPIADENDPETELSVKTQFGKPLEFNVDPAQATKSFEDGLYFDSLVKFTVCDDAPQQEYADAKIVMWLQEDPTGVGDATKTNLYVKAGYLYDNSGSLAVSNVTYKCDNTFDADFADKWHRVTIKAIGTIANGVTVPGFAIFIDGGDDVNIKKVGTTAAKWDANLLDFTEAVENLVTDGQLFPSMQQGDVAGVTTLSCAGFDGTGWLNDLVFTDVVPFDDAKDNVAPKVNVNGKEYTTFEEAVGAVNGITAAGDVTVTLLKDMTLSGTLAFASQTDVNVVFDFAGKVLTNNGSTPAISNAGTLTITNSVGNGGIVCTSTGEAVVSDALAESTLITAGYFDGVVAEQGLGALQISGGSFKYNTMTGSLVEGKEFQLNSDTGLYDVGEATPGTVITIAENPWYENPKAVVLAENLPGQTGNIVSAFHGQGQGEYLGLTYSTNPLQFDLYQVDGTNALVTNRSIAAADVTNPGFRGVAISKILGIAMTLRYATSTTMYAYPLAGGDPTAVTLSKAVAFDAAAFSPDGKYLFSNAVAGEDSNQFYVKWAVSDGGATLTRIGGISAGGRARSLAYARLNGRDLVFGLIDSGKIAVIDMTGDDSSAWSAADLVTGLPAHSYGTLCVSGVTAVDAQGNAATPHLTVATSTNNGATKGDVLNVYALTVPASGAVSASLTKSFDEDALTAAGFGDISDANRYGNTVYVTEDEATIYFARPDNKLYAAQYDAWVAAGLGFDGEAYTIADETQLEAFQAAANASTTAGKTFKLTANIALTEAWPGIGIQNGKDLATGDASKIAQFDAGAFCGTFDGQNYTISGFQMIGKGDNAEGLDYCGFFNSTYGATIQNLKIQYAGSLFAADTTASTKESGATFVGVAKNSTLRNLTTVAGTVSCSKGFGGIVGYLTSGTLVDSCTNNVNMTSLANNKCGGIAMIAQSGSAVTIQNCQNNGTQTTGSSNSEYGAIVGYVGLDITIANCETTVGRFLKHQGSTVTLQGVNKGDARVLAYHGAATPGLNFATVDGNVATFVADDALALNGSYKVVGPTSATATFVFAEAGTIAFDTNLVQNVTLNITAPELDLADTTENGVVTFTATVPAPEVTPIDPSSNTPSAEVKAADADAAIEAVEIATPTQAGDSAEAKAAYKDLFNYSAVETSEGSGVYTVTMTGIKEEEVAKVNDAAVDSLVSAAQDAEATTVSVAVPAGLYYKVTTYDTLGGEAVDTKSGQSTGAGTTPVAKPESTTQGFIKVEMGTKAFN